MDNIKTRNIQLDYIRVIATLLVVFNHSISTFYIDQLNPELYNSLGIYSKLFMVNSYILSRLGVPLFLLISGALILNKKFETYKDIKQFYKNNLLSLLITVIIWNVIYYFLNIIINNETINIIDLLLTTHYS